MEIAPRRRVSAKAALEAQHDRAAFPIAFAQTGEKKTKPTVRQKNRETKKRPEIPRSQRALASRSAKAVGGHFGRVDSSFGRVDSVAGRRRRRLVERASERRQLRRRPRFPRRRDGGAQKKNKGARKFFNFSTRKIKQRRRCQTTLAAPR